MKAKLVKLLKKIWSYPAVSRAVHTFWQASASFFIVGIPVVLTMAHDNGFPAAESALISLAAGAFAAGLSALKTALVQWKTVDKP